MQLGQRVKVRAVVVPREFNPGAHWIIKERKYVRVEQDHVGFVAGVRVLKEGRTSDEDEYGFAFEPTRHVRVYLVAVSLRQMVRVLPEDLEVE